MASETLLKNVQKAFELIKKRNEMSIEELNRICEQYGVEANGLEKSELILLILKKELNEQEFNDYQKYVRYSNFRHSMSSLSALDDSVDQIQKIFERKYELSLEKNRADNGRRAVEFALINELPLVRLNIEYSHVKSAYDDYISRKASSGIKIASLSDELEHMKSKNMIYRFLNRGKIEDLRRKKHETRSAALEENDEMFTQYGKTVKAYVDMLREMFYKMLDDRLIANSVYLYRNLPMDTSQEDFYKVGSIQNVRFDLEEKERIFEDFLQDANFDPEREVTGTIFYDAVKKYVTKYYSIMEARLSIKQGSLVKEIKDIVDRQKGMVSGIYQDLSMQYGTDGEVLSSLYTSGQNLTKKKK